MKRVALALLCLLGIPSLALANNSGAVVKLCVIVSNSQDYGATVTGLPWAVTGMNTDGTAGVLNIPTRPSSGTPLCTSLGYVEENSSASVAQWDVAVLKGLGTLASAVQTNWHNDNTAVITSNPHNNAFLCGAEVTSDCIEQRPQTVSWQEGSQGPISLMVDLGSP